ncbi:MAG: DUF2059 domain-containing protein [Arenimonas sp.]
MKNTGLAIALFLLSFNTQAASIERAEQFVKAINSDKTITQIISIMSDASQQGFMNSCESDKKVSRETCVEMAVDFGKSLNDILTQAFEPKSFMKEMAEIYASEFTDEELDQLIAFYTSPAGKAYINKLPALMQKSSVLGQKRSQKVLPEIERLIREKVQAGKDKKPS